MPPYTPTLDDFPFEGSQRAHIATCQRLLILGKPGTGKTALANVCLANHIVLRIDSYHLKQWDYIQERLRLHRTQRNVLRMFQEDSGVTDTKGILLDTVEVFYRYDKKSYAWFEELFKSCYESIPLKVILVMDDHLQNVRSLTQITHQESHLRVHLTHSKRTYDRGVRKQCQADARVWSADAIQSVIAESKGSFSKAQELIASGPTRIHRITDDFTGFIGFSETTARLRDLLKHPYSFEERLRLSASSSTLQLNALDRVTPFLVKYPKDVFDIYRGYRYAETMETFVNTHHEWGMAPYADCMGFMGLATIFRARAPVALPTHLPHHSYLSKSLIQHHGSVASPTVPEATLYHDIYNFYVEGLPIPEATLQSLETRTTKEKGKITQLFKYAYQMKIRI